MDTQELIKNLERRGFKTSEFETKEEAAAYLKANITGKKVAFGGSMTLKEMKLYELLSEHNQVIWHWNEPGRETLLKAREASVYLCSANAVARTGEIVNIDGTGNRVSMTLYGPEKTYFVVGVNKIAPDLHGALDRAKNVAAPLNAKRLSCKTPCAVNGDRCYDCKGSSKICHATVIMEMPPMGMEVEVVIIHQELGY